MHAVNGERTVDEVSAAIEDALTRVRTMGSDPEAVRST